MAFGAAGNDAQTAFDQFFRHRCGVDFHLFRVFFELGLQGFFERNGFGVAMTCISGPPCRLGKMEEFNALLRVVAAQNHAAARAAQGGLWVVVVTKSQNGTDWGIRRRQSGLRSAPYRQRGRHRLCRRFRRNFAQSICGA